MSMSTHVIGFVPPDEKWRAMRDIWNACEKAGVEVPDAVAEFFDGEKPDEAGVEMELPVTAWHDDGREGYELDLDLLPPHVKIIRFYNSW